MKRHLHGDLPEAVDAEALRKEVEELRQRNKDLEEQVAQLQVEVSWCVAWELSNSLTSYLHLSIL